MGADKSFQGLLCLRFGMVLRRIKASLNPDPESATAVPGANHKEGGGGGETTEGPFRWRWLIVAAVLISGTAVTSSTVKVKYDQHAKHLSSTTLNNCRHHVSAITTSFNAGLEEALSVGRILETYHLSPQSSLMPPGLFKDLVGMHKSSFASFHSASFFDYAERSRQPEIEAGLGVPIWHLASVPPGSADRKLIVCTMTSNESTDLLGLDISNGELGDVVAASASSQSFFLSGVSGNFSDSGAGSSLGKTNLLVVPLFYQTEAQIAALGLPPLLAFHTSGMAPELCRGFLIVCFDIGRFLNATKEASYDTIIHVWGMSYDDRPVLLYSSVPTEEKDLVQMGGWTKQQKWVQLDKSAAAVVSFELGPNKARFVMYCRPLNPVRFLKMVPYFVAGLLATLLVAQVMWLGLRRMEIAERNFRNLLQLKNDTDKAKDAAAAADKAKSSFLATVSHEIRTPLNGVLGMLSLLLDTVLSSAQTDLAQTALSSGKALLTLVNDVLDLSKIESGHMDIECVPFNAAEELDDVLSMFAERVSGKEFELAAHVMGDMPPLLLGDPNRFRQVLINLMGNALKFCERGHILVTILAVPEKTSAVGDLTGAVHSPLHEASEAQRLGTPSGSPGRDSPRGHSPRARTSNTSSSSPTSSSITQRQRSESAATKISAVARARVLKRMQTSVITENPSPRAMERTETQARDWGGGGGWRERRKDEERGGVVGNKEIELGEVIVEEVTESLPTLSGYPVAMAEFNAQDIHVQFGKGLGRPRRWNRGEYVRLLTWVEDTGIGIPDDAQDRIFKPFQQVGTSTARLYGGTGIGLNISKRLIELMSGSISFISKHGIGTTFRFDIRLKTAPSHLNSSRTTSQPAPPANPNIIYPNILNLQQASSSTLLPSPDPSGSSDSQTSPGSALVPILKSALRSKSETSPSLPLVSYNPLFSTPPGRSTSRLGLGLQIQIPDSPSSAQLELSSRSLNSGSESPMSARLLASPSTLKGVVVGCLCLNPLRSAVMKSYLVRLEMICVPVMAESEGSSAKSRSIYPFRKKSSVRVPHPPLQVVLVELNDIPGPSAPNVARRSPDSSLRSCTVSVKSKSTAHPPSAHGKSSGRDAIEVAAAWVRDSLPHLVDATAGGFTVPVLAVTIHRKSKLEDTAKRAGIAGIVAKPLRKDSLAASLLEVLFPSFQSESSKPSSGEGSSPLHPTPQAPVSVPKTSISGRSKSGVLSEKHLLVVDDNEINLKVARLMLSKHGAEVVCVDSGRKAIAALQERDARFDLVFMDVQMPDMDGRECARIIRRMEAGGEIVGCKVSWAPSVTRLPIIALTADAMKGSWEQCEASGMCGFLTKPLNKDQLMKAIRPFLTLEKS